MRILILADRIPPENRGGAGVVTWRLAQALHHAGHDVHIIAATEEPPFDDVRDGIPTYHIHSQYAERWRAYLSLYNPQTAQPLKQLYQRIQPDVINAHNIHTDIGYYALTLAHRMSIPVVFSSHDVMLFAYHKLSHFINPAVGGVQSPADYRLPPFFNLRQMRLRYNPARNRIIRHMLTHHAQERTTPSHALAMAHQANDLPSFTTVHNGLDAAQFDIAPATIDALHHRLNLQGRKVILFAGRLTKAKGTQQLLQALSYVVQTVPEALLLVLSSIPIQEQVREAAFEHLLAHHVISGGWLEGDELAAAFHVARCVVAPSIIFDTFPTVNLEAMAAAKPVLATCYGGSDEAVVDGKTGYIINPFDTADFAHKLMMVLQDDDLYQHMGQAGYERLQAHFTMQHQMQQMIQLYQSAQVKIRGV